MAPISQALGVSASRDLVRRRTPAASRREVVGMDNQETPTPRRRGVTMRAFPRLGRTQTAKAPADEPDEPRGDPRPEVVETATMRWINIDEPRLADRVWLAETFGFHELDLEDVASHNQRPKVDEYLRWRRSWW